MPSIEHDFASVELSQARRNQPPESQLAPQDLPSTIYAAHISPEFFRQDVQAIKQELREAVPPAEIALNVVDRHWQGKEEPGATAAHVYAADLVESVRRHPEHSVAQHAQAFEPTATDRTRWEPLVSSVSLEVADSFQWTGSNGSVQSYRQESSLNYLHLDGPSGQFYDRDKNPISKEAALDHALPQEALERGISIQGQEYGSRDRDTAHTLAIS